MSEQENIKGAKVDQGNQVAHKDRDHQGLKKPSLPVTPGQQGIVLTLVFIGLLFMGIQLWLLSVALDLFLGGKDQNIWLLAGISGLIFSGGLLALYLLRRILPFKWS